MKTALRNHFAGWAQVQLGAYHVSQVSRESLRQEMADVINAVEVDVCSWLENADDSTVINLVIDAASGIDPTIAGVASIIVDALHAGCALRDGQRQGSQGKWLLAAAGVGLGLILGGLFGGGSST